MWRAHNFSPSPPPKKKMAGALKNPSPKAADLSASSLCLPCLGCGIRGWPADVVAQIALQALAESEAVSRLL